MEFESIHWETEQLPKLKERIINQLNILNKKGAFDNLEEYIGRIEKIKNLHYKEDSFVKSNINEIVHEIDVAYTLISNGIVKCANDNSNGKNTKSSIDIDYLFKYKIECGCANQGQEKNIEKYKKEAHYLKTDGSMFDTFDKKVMLERIINTIEGKIKQYQEKFLKHELVNKGTKFIIALASKDVIGPTGIKSYSNGCELLEILFNKNIDFEIQKIKLNEFNNESKMVNNRNFFDDKTNNFISGFLYSTAQFNEEYDVTNNFLFLNPNSKNKINVEDFPQFNYWKYDKKTGYYEFKKAKITK